VPTRTAMKMFRVPIIISNVARIENFENLKVVTLAFFRGHVPGQFQNAFRDLYAGSIELAFINAKADAFRLAGQLDHAALLGEFPDIADRQYGLSLQGIEHIGQGVFLAAMDEDQLAAGSLFNIVYFCDGQDMLLRRLTLQRVEIPVERIATVQANRQFSA